MSVSGEEAKSCFLLKALDLLLGMNLDRDAEGHRNVVTAFKVVATCLKVERCYTQYTGDNLPRRTVPFTMTCICMGSTYGYRIAHTHTCLPSLSRPVTGKGSGAISYLLEVASVTYKGRES